MPINDPRVSPRITKTAIVHKVIDVTPHRLPPPKKTSISESIVTVGKRFGPVVAVGAAVLALAVVLLAVLHPGGKSVDAPALPVPAVVKTSQAAPVVETAVAVAVAPKISQKPAVQVPLVIELNLPTAVQQGLVECQWRGNGKDRLVLDARNTGNQALRLHLPAGQLLASVDSTVVVLKSETLDFAPGAELHEEFPTVATSSANKVIGAEYHLSDGTLPDLDKLFAYVASHPAASASAVQTAALILTENLPLSAFAKFNELSAGAGQVQESKDFKAETCDILSALIIVKDIGINRPLAVTIDPQLEIEAMIDPAAHGLALSYYGISDEWAFWKSQLLQGDPSTRHYALYGIARYYPSVALVMLPKWARQESMSPVYRLSAVEALGQTGKADAIPILRELEREFGGTSDLGRAAHLAANYLDAQFAAANRISARLNAAGDVRQPALASVGN